MNKNLYAITMIFALVFFSVSSNAQLQRGNLLLGSDIANFNIGLKKGSVFSFVIDPKLAWFVKDNLALGAYLNFGLSTAKGAGTNIDYGVGALGRYYINDKNINLLHQGRFFLEANVGIDGTNPSHGDNTNGLGVGFGPGWTYFISPNIGLEALLKYRGIIGFGSAVTSHALNLNVGFQIYLPTARARAIRDELRERQ